jgi:hypothetical protein
VLMTELKSLCLNVTVGRSQDDDAGLRLQSD